jgi:peptidyl-prolyl cis-trans isomerase D
LKASYEATKAAFGTPETRRIEQIVFADLASAQKAYDALKSGKDFLAVAKEAGKTEKDIDRGVVRKEDLLDKKAAEAAFSFGAQTFTVPVEGDLAISILRARDIKPATQKTFEEVKSEVEDRLKLEGAQKKLVTLVAEVEDKRAGATPLADIAKAMGLEFVAVAAIDRASKGPDGKAIAIAGTDPVLTVAFGKDVGVESDPISLGNAGYVWVEVLEITPTRQKTFDEVKVALTESWTRNERIKALTEQGRALVVRANAGEPLSKLAGELQLQTKTAPPFTRRNPGDVPASAAKLAFALAKGSAGTTSTDDSKGRVIMRLTEITAPKPLDKEQKDKLNTQLQRMVGADQQAQYLQSLDGELGFSVDTAAFNRLAGGADGSGS